MPVEKTKITGKYPRAGWEVRCDKCRIALCTGLTKKNAEKNAGREHFRWIEASDSAKGYWICEYCYAKWPVQLTIQQFLRGTK